MLFKVSTQSTFETGDDDLWGLMLKRELCDFRSTNSEIVVPVVTKDNVLLAVLDVDSDAKDAFSEADRRALEAVCNLLAGTAWSSGLLF